MEKYLVLATWVGPAGVVLGAVEAAVLLRLRPPLNLEKVGETRVRLRVTRGAMATASRNWPVDGGPPAPEMLEKRYAD